MARPDFSSQQLTVNTRDKSGFVNRPELPYPKIIYYLFLLFSAYLVLPFIEVPLLNLSLSAPIFFVIAITLLLKSPKPWFHTYRHWFYIAILLWLGIFISTWANGLLSWGVEIVKEGILTVIRYLYWLLVFVITTYFASQGSIIKKVSTILGWSVFVLSLLRWYELIRYGNFGAWTGTHLLTQNTYGFLFSTFSPFLMTTFFQEQRWKRLIAWVTNLLLLSAVAINGSRGSWVAVATGLSFFIILLAISRPKKIVGVTFLFLFITSIAGMAWVSFPKVSNTVIERFNTFENLNSDKSFMVRQLMIQKGWRLFKESPIIGVGASRFTESSIPLDIPKILAYSSQSRFDTRSAHNSYVGFLAEYGLLGSMPFFLLLITLLIGGFRAALLFTKKGQYWALIIFISFIQMSIHMWVVSSVTNTGNWYIYGLVAASFVLYNRERKYHCG